MPLTAVARVAIGVGMKCQIGVTSLSKGINNLNPTSSFPTQKQPKTTIIQKQESLFYGLSSSEMLNVVPELYA